MPSVRDLLARFRPAGAPGAATAAGVPADRRADLTSELEPVFAALASTRQECQRLRRAADSAATRTVAEADRQAQAVLARARIEAEAERADAQAQARAQGAATVAAIAQDAGREVEDVRRQAELLIPALVDRLVDRVRAAVAEATRAGEVPDG
jgi:hypothetical protein